MNTGRKAFRCEGKGIESKRSDSHTRMLAIDVMVEGGGKILPHDILQARCLFKDKPGGHHGLCPSEDANVEIQESFISY